MKFKHASSVCFAPFPNAEDSSAGIDPGLHPGLRGPPSRKGEGETGPEASFASHFQGAQRAC